MSSAIDVTDALGDHWSLIFWQYTRSRREAWMHVFAGPQALYRYHRIPVPVFTDWWPT